MAVFKTGCTQLDILSQSRVEADIDCTKAYNSIRASLLAPDLLGRRQGASPALRKDAPGP